VRIAHNVIGDWQDGYFGCTSAAPFSSGCTERS
jgi:hypothetical protein